MLTKRIITPGGPGTKKLLVQYGERLVCVRYRYAEEKSERISTVELIVDRTSWETGKKKPHPSKMIEIEIQYGEIQLGRLARAAGGKWNRVKKVWELPYREVKALGLENRIKKNPL